MNGKKYVELYEDLDNQRANLRSRWDSVIDYFIPGHGDQYGQRTLDAHEWDVFDRTGVEALRDFAAGIYSHTVNINSPWFTLRINDPDLNDITEVKDALTNAAKSLYRKLQDSNLEQTLTQLFTFFGAFGTAVMYVDVVDGKFRFKNYSPTDVVLTEDEHGMVDKVLRKFEYRAEQAYDRWGDSCPDEIVTAATSGDPMQANRKFQFLHVVCERKERDQKAKNKENKPWASYYIAKDKGKIVDEGGYDSMPYMTPRFYRHDESVWGQSPAIAHVDTMAMLCKIRYDIAEHTEAALFPPLFTDDEEGVENNLLSMKPRSVNYYKSKTNTPPFSLSPGQGRLQESLAFYQDTVKSVRNAFFADLFLHQMNDDPNRTATEVMERKTERGIRISPVVVNVETELFGPMIVRCLTLAIENGFIEPFPEILYGQEYEVSYTNRLASLLSRSEMQGAMQAYEEAARVAELAMTFPTLSDVVDQDKVIMSIFESYNVDPEFTRDEEETADIREQRQAEIDQQRQAEMQSKAIKPIDPNAPVQEGSPLDELQEAQA